jgi:proteasome lid subunit RPN8/RPN11
MGSQAAAAAPAIGSVVIQVSKRLTEDFKKKAKKSFPNEAYAFLLGHTDEEKIIIDSLFYPTDVDSYCTPGAVDVQWSWYMEARREAKRNNLTIVGDIHSHPYKKHAKHIDASPSETDWDGLVGGHIMAICGIKQLQNGHLRARTKFWGPMPQVKVKTTK